MMNILQDIWGVLTTFELVDYVLYISVVTLIVLIVSLIYVIKNEKNEVKYEMLEQEGKSVKNSVEENEELDLQNIVNIIDEKPKPLIDMTAYEEEQEQKAIISYEELLKMEIPNEINYSDEELVDDIIPVKRIQINPIELPKEIEEFAGGLKLTQKEPKFEVESESIQKETKEIRLFSYEKEEAFLQALKKLNELLN